jgi:hypothetical protein
MEYPPPETYHLPLFGGAEVQRWDPEPLPPEGEAALNRFLALSPSALRSVSRHVFAYYLDMMAHLNGTGWPGVPLPDLSAPDQVWDHVTPKAVFIHQGDSGDQTWFVGVEANVPWEANRGLGLYWADGDWITKVGPVDGWASNAAAYADPSLANVVYAAMFTEGSTNRDD